MKNPDMLINQDAQVLALLQSLIGRNGREGLCINLFSVNQINLNLDSRKLNSPDQKMIMSPGQGRPKHQPLLPNGRNLSKDEIVQALNDCGWSRIKAAEQLKRNYSALCQKIRNLGIVPPSGAWPRIRE